jgi:hypothetical protein
MELFGNRIVAIIENAIITWEGYLSGQWPWQVNIDIKTMV